jgi:SAM-dependent methyltransferase
MSEHFDQAFWDARYASAPALWSGKPNPHLVAIAGNLAPGRALDAGAGEGADAIWLAVRGWRVTAVELSVVALERASAQADSLGDGVAGRIEWLHEDLMTWTPPAASFDLVSAQYLHVPAFPRRALFERLAAAVATGGALLIVGHHPSDLETSIPRPPMPELFFTGDEIAASLGQAQWEIVANTAAARTATDPHGREVTIHDTVLHARRVREGAPGG